MSWPTLPLGLELGFPVQEVEPSLLQIGARKPSTDPVEIGLSRMPRLAQEAHAGFERRTVRLAQIASAAGRDDVVERRLAPTLTWG